MKYLFVFILSAIVTVFTASCAHSPGHREPSSSDTNLPLDAGYIMTYEGSTTFKDGKDPIRFENKTAKPRVVQVPECINSQWAQFPQVIKTINCSITMTVPAYTAFTLNLNDKFLLKNKPSTGIYLFETKQGRELKLTCNGAGERTTDVSSNDINLCFNSFGFKFTPPAISVDPDHSPEGTGARTSVQ